MPKYLTKTRKRDSEFAARVKKTAILAGVSKRLVYMVIKGDRVNDEVLTVYMELLAGENKLLQEVEKLVPFN